MAHREFEHISTRLSHCSLASPRLTWPSKHNNSFQVKWRPEFSVGDTLLAHSSQPDIVCVGEFAGGSDEEEEKNAASLWFLSSRADQWQLRLQLVHFFTSTMRISASPSNSVLWLVFNVENMKDVWPIWASKGLLKDPRNSLEQTRDNDQYARTFASSAGTSWPIEWRP